MRYCGNCGAELDAAATSSGTCPTCGMALDPSTVSAVPLAAPPSTGDLQQTVLDTGNVSVGEDRWGPIVPLELRLAQNDPMALANARPNTTRMARMTANQPMNPLTVIGLGVGLGVALLLILVGVLTFLTLGAHPASTVSQSTHPAKTVTIGPTATDAGLGFATQAPNPTALPYTAPSPLPTETPYGGIPTATTGPAPTQPGAPTDTPTPSSGQATLVVGDIKCRPDLVAATFLVGATGGGSLTWQASASAGIVSPTGPATLMSGQTQQITVTPPINNIVTVTAQPGNQTKTLNISCPTH